MRVYTRKIGDNLFIHNNAKVGISRNQVHKHTVGRDIPKSDFRLRDKRTCPWDFGLKTDGQGTSEKGVFRPGTNRHQKHYFLNFRDKKTWFL